VDRIHRVRVLHDHAHHDHLLYAHHHVRGHHDHVPFLFYRGRGHHDRPLF